MIRCLPTPSCMNGPTGTIRAQQPRIAALRPLHTPLRNIKSYNASRQAVVVQAAGKQYQLGTTIPNAAIEPRLIPSTCLCTNMRINVHGISPGSMHACILVDIITLLVAAAGSGYSDRSAHSEEAILKLTDTLRLLETERDEAVKTGKVRCITSLLPNSRRSSSSKQSQRSLYSQPAADSAAGQGPHRSMP